MRTNQREILSQIEVGKPQEYFVYFKVFEPKSCSKRFAERRSRFIQRFRSFSIACFSEKRKPILRETVDKPSAVRFFL